MAAQGGKTKYPALMVHGGGFRDLRRPLYWGRIASGLGLFRAAKKRRIATTLLFGYKSSLFFYL